MKGLVKNLAHVLSAGIYTTVGVHDGKNATSAEQHSSSTDRNTVEHALANHMVLLVVR